MAGQRTLRALVAAELIAGLAAVPVLSASQTASSASAPLRSSASKASRSSAAAGNNQPSVAVSLASANNDVTTPCQAPDLALSPQDVKVAMGTVLATYRVQSIGSAACSLSAADTDWLKPAVGTGRVDSVVNATRTLAPGASSTVKVAYHNEAPVPQSTAPAPATPAPRGPTLPVLPSLPSVPRLPTVPAPAPAAPSALAHIVSSATTVPQTIGGAINAVAGLVTTTTTRPAPPPRQGAQTPAPVSSSANYRSGMHGYDISWPQCGSPYPPAAPIAVVGVNDGRAFTSNPCLASEAAWAGSAREVYMNLNSPHDGSDPYRFGYDAATQSVNTAANQGVQARTWWLDIETVGQCGDYWSCDQAANASTIQGALNALRRRGLVAGVYSTSYQWDVVTGGYNPSGGAPPNWLAGVYPDRVGEFCAGGHNFAGGVTWLTQLWKQSTYDEDQSC